jgi:hypothetical protein
MIFKPPLRPVPAATLAVTFWAIGPGSVGAIAGSSQLSSNRQPGPLAAWLLTRDRAARSDYVGPAVCSACHPSQAEGQKKSLMAGAAVRSGDSEVLRTHPELRVQRDGYFYEVRRDGDHAVYTVGDGARTISEALGWAFGFGALGQTYVFVHQGAYYESRVSYFTALQNLDITVGHSTEAPASLAAALGNRLTPKDVAQCFSCHTTAAVVSGRLDPNGLIPGVTCEACHGPGARHVAAMKAGKLREKFIFNPARLDAEGLIDYCGTCHRTGLAVLALGQRGPKTVRFQPYRLVSSRCWTGSDSRLTCIACHDPHQPLEHNSSSYDVRCLACHASKAGTKPDPQKRAPACRVSERDCTTCHMPKVELPGGHAQFSDHYIRVVQPGEAYPD